MGSGKPRGINAARKLRTMRRQQRWASKTYKKAHLGTQFKCNPFGGSSHCKGIVLEKIGIEAKQPNSAIRKCVRAQLIKNGKKIAAFVPRDGCLNFIDENVRRRPNRMRVAAAAMRQRTQHDRGSSSDCGQGEAMQAAELAAAVAGVLRPRAVHSGVRGERGGPRCSGLAGRGSLLWQLPQLTSSRRRPPRSRALAPLAAG